MQLRFIAFAAFFLSGASSLIFQSIWSRMFARVFGATSIAISSVVTVFMLGLGLGAWLAGKYADRIKHPIITYAIAEIGVGAWALLVPELVGQEGWLATVNRTLRESMGAESSGFMVARFLCVVPILIVPTTLMGSTLPLLARHFVAQEQRAGGTASRVGVLYAVNTFGAVAGVNLAAFVLMPNVGLAWTNRVALGLNFLLAALIFLFRGPLLRGIWRPGEPLAWLPSRSPTEAATEPDEPSTADAAPVVEDSALVVPPIARKAAFIVFAASGAAALCYEVVWTRALAMVNGSSVYSFALILETFLVGIAGGSAVAAGFLGGGRNRASVVAISAILLSMLANVPWAIHHDWTAWAGASSICAFLVLVLLLLILVRRRAATTEEFEHDPSIMASFMLAVPVMSSIVGATSFSSYLSSIVVYVVGVLVLFLLVLLWLRRYLILLLACMQLLIAVAAFFNYRFQDDIPYAFAQMVASLGIDDLPNRVGTVMFFMFVTTALCTLPATLGMGAMFPVTLRVWASGGKRIGRDVGVLYAGNTVGSIIGAWVPGFLLMPWIGIERTLHVGMALNLLLALIMLVTSAAESPEATAKADSTAKAGAPAGSRVPIWHSVVVYVLAPLIPAMGALLYFGTAHADSPLRWDVARMTLGVFRVSLAKDILNEDEWGTPNIVFYRDGLSTTVSVEKWGSHVAVKNNGKVDASNGDDMPTQIMVAGYPFLMHPKPFEEIEAAVIGFGSGVTVGSALEFPVKAVHVIELERSIPQSSYYFKDVNRLHYPHPPDHPDARFPYVERDRLTVINDDGRNYLSSTTRQYDVIISEPSNPWITGVADLFTTDHFRVTKKRLRPGGIYCQWVQLYELSPENIKSIYRTFASQFEHVMVFAADELSSDTMLIGSDEPLLLDLNRIARGWDYPAVAEVLGNANIDTPFMVMGRVILKSRGEVEQYAQIESWLEGAQWVDRPETNNAKDDPCPEGECRRRPAPLNTDDNAHIEFAAPRDLIGFARYEGYLARVYAEEWPYGRLEQNLPGMGTGAVAARNYAELALALVGSGRKSEATRMLDASQRAGGSAETLVALEVLRLLLSNEGEPTAHIEPPTPGPEMDRESAEQLVRGFSKVREAVDQEAYAVALAALEEIPTSVRLNGGDSLKFLHGYLLYKTAAHEEAVAYLDEVSENAAFLRTHPEVQYFLGRCHDAAFSFQLAARAMRTYVEASLATQAAARAEEPDSAPTPAEPADGAPSP